MGSEPDQIMLLSRREPVPKRHDETTIRRPREFGHRTVDLSSPSYVERNDVATKQWCGHLDGGELARSCSSTNSSKDCDSCYVRRNLLQQLKPFDALAVFERHESGHIAARARHTPDI